MRRGRALRTAAICVLSSALGAPGAARAAFIQLYAGSGNLDVEVVAFDSPSLVPTLTGSLSLTSSAVPVKAFVIANNWDTPGPGTSLDLSFSLTPGPTNPAINSVVTFDATPGITSYGHVWDVTTLVSGPGLYSTHRGTRFLNRPGCTSRRRAW